MKSEDNLRAVLEHFEIRNKSVAAALNVDPSMITRWMNGDRLISVHSKYLEPLADYILSRNLTHEDTEWLEKRFHEYGIKGDFASVSEIKHALKIWLVTDPNDDIADILKNSEGLSVSPNIGGRQMGKIHSENYSVKAGMTDITLHLSSLFALLEPGSIVYIRISGESAAIHDSFVHAVKNAAGTFSVRFKIMLCVSGKTKQPSKVIETYLEQIVRQDMEISVVYEDSASFTEETLVIIPEQCIVTITMLADSPAPASALLVYEKTYLRDMEKSFLETLACSQPVFASLAESTGRRMQSLAKESYETAGRLSVIRDGLNPLYMSKDGYEAFLKARRHEGEAYDWRMQEFCERKAAMDRSLKNGMILRELIPSSLLLDIAAKGSRALFGEDFLETGEVPLDRKMCLNLLEGYVRYLNIFPNFSLRISGSFPGIFNRSVLLIKENRHVLIKSSSKNGETHLFSQQLILLQGISQAFETIWDGLDYITRGGETTLQSLKCIMRDIEAGG